MKLNPGDAIATAIVRRIDELFGIDAEARAQNLDHAARHALRQERAQPLLDLLKPQIEAAGAQASAFQRTGQGGHLHARAVAQTHALPGASGGGAEQQPGRELDAPGRSGTKELDPRGESDRPDRKWRPSCPSSRAAAG